MVSQGWAMLCFEILVAEELKDLHLTALRLLLAMTGGGNIDVQDIILYQLTDVDWCPHEIFAASCRKLLRKCVQDLKVRRKHLLLTKANEERGSDMDASTTPLARGHAVETLSLLSNCCKGAHSGMQDYIRDQPGHQEQFNLIADVIYYINQLERDLKDEVIEESKRIKYRAKQLLTSSGASKDPIAYKRASHWVSPNVDKSYAAFHFLSLMGTGPHFGNQLAITNSEIIPVMNRMLAYSAYDCIADINSEGRTNATTKGQMHAQIARLLMILLSGVPRPAVIKRLLGALDWQAYAVHLGILKDVMKNGTIAATHDLTTSDESLFEEESTSPRSPRSPKGAEDPSEKKFKHDLHDVPLYVCDPEKHYYAEWLSKEAYRLFTIVEKVRIAGEEMERSGNEAYSNCLEPLRLLLSDGEMMSFFHERVGQVEVIREGVLERVFFLRPANSLVKRDADMLERHCTKTIDEAPRQDSTEKLQAFLEGAVEIVAVLDSQDKVSDTLGKRLGAFLPPFFAWYDKKIPTMGLSTLICINLMASYTRCDDVLNDVSEMVFDADENFTQCEILGGSLSRATYSRSQQWPLPVVGAIGYELAILFGVIHVALTVLRAYSFLIIRFPVLLEMYDRKDRLDYVKGTHLDDANEREDFIACSVLIYGLPFMAPDDSLSTVLSQTLEVATGNYKQHVQPLESEYVRRLFHSYGDVGVARVVRVKQEPDEDGKYKGSGNNSWALVNFEKLSAVRKLMDDQHKSLHPPSTGSHKEPEPLGVKASLRPDAQIERVSIVDLNMEEVDRSTTLKDVTREAMLEYKIAHKDFINTSAQKIQGIADTFQIGRLLPISVVVRFRADPEVRESLMDIALSLLGFAYNPLFFSYHLFKVAKLPGANIVVRSMTHNIVR